MSRCASRSATASTARSRRRTSTSVNCALAIVQAGIETVVTYKPADGDEHWLESIDKSRVVFEEAGVEFLELERELERA